MLLLAGPNASMMERHAPAASECLAPGMQLSWTWRRIMVNGCIPGSKAPGHRLHNSIDFLRIPKPA